MKITKKLFNALMDEKIRIVCIDGQVFNGVWIDHTSKQDNEPDGESITIETDYAPFVEIYVEDIERIEAR
jgi:hypothetical protein